MLTEQSIFAGRYRIVRRLASGGMGVVYEASHLETERGVALKVLAPEIADRPELRKRFRVEARAATRLESPHLVQILDAGVDEATGSPFLVMELLRGEDLERRIEREGRLSADEVRELLSELALGLDALHEAGIVHRDLKPSNVFLVARERGGVRVKILDLGVAKLLGEGARAGTTAALGTPLYMAPEQLKGRAVSAATDLHALGMLAYTLLVGRAYWADEADRSESLLAFAMITVEGPSEPASARAARLGVRLPKGFDAWFAQATASAPERRFASARAAVDALAEALELEPLAASREATPAARNPKKSRRRIPGLALSALALGVGVFWVTRARQSVAPELPAPAAIPPIEAISCAPAQIAAPEGAKASAEISRALGLGACARFGVALGVAWDVPEAPHRLEVGATLLPRARARVRLALGDKHSEAEGESPLEAADAAARAFAPSFVAAPLSTAEIAAWGASDEASARQIRSAFWRHTLLLSSDPLAEAETLASSQPQSAFSHAILAHLLRRGDKQERAYAERDEALARMSVLPLGRAHALEGGLRIFFQKPGDDRSSGGVEMLRQSYGEIPDDPDFLALYTLGGCILVDELPPIFDRLAARSPTFSLPMLLRCIGAVAQDGARKQRYVALLRDHLPEALAYKVHWLLEEGMLEEARSAFGLGSALGPPSLHRVDLVEDRALLALAALDADEATRAAEELLGDPDWAISNRGAELRVAALLVRGQAAEAIAAIEREALRQQGAGRFDAAAASVFRALRFRRWLGQPLHDGGKGTPWLEAQLGKGTEGASWIIRGIQAERAQLRARAAKEELAALEAEIDGDTSASEFGRELAHAHTLSLVRAARGDEAALTLFLRLRLAEARAVAAFDAALALEALGKSNKAESAYRLAMAAPWSRPFEAMAGRARLASLLARAGRGDEARALEEELGRAWAGADHGLADTIRGMR